MFPTITLPITQWDLEPTRSWAVYAIKKLLSPRSSQCRDKILTSQLVYCGGLGHRSRIIQGQPETIHVPLNLEKAFFTTSGFNQFVINSVCWTHFLGPLKYTALTRGCSWNPNMGIQSPATSCWWLFREWDSGGQGLLNKAALFMRKFQAGPSPCVVPFTAWSYMWCQDKPQQGPSLHELGGRSMPSLLEVFGKVLPGMDHAPSPAYLCILLQNHLLVQAASRGCDSASAGTCWEEPGSFKCVEPQLMLLQHIFSEAMPLSAILSLYLTSFQSKAFFETQIK